jgi:hypothetical protein
MAHGVFKIGTWDSNKYRLFKNNFSSLNIKTKLIKQTKKNNQKNSINNFKLQSPKFTPFFVLFNLNY